MTFLPPTDTAALTQPLPHPIVTLASKQGVTKQDEAS
jgi:hypothetical protein